MRQNPQGTRALLESRLSVDPKSLPEHYRYFYAQPWRRIYTLNFDDLEMAVANRFDLPRNPKSISATSNIDNEDSANPPGSQLEVVHLNGCITDNPADLTFSEQQYAQQIIAPNRWYIRCVEELRARPVIYVGTELRESTLWTYIELRARRHRQADVISPGSILVTPTLSRAREALLKEYNVDWISMTAEQFSVVLQELRDATQQGFYFIKQYNDNYGRPGLPLVSELVAERPRLDTEYLLGDEPQWADLNCGRAAERNCDNALRDIANSLLSNRQPNTALAITGTAGSGKSTAIMRLSLDLSNAGLPVIWIDRDSNALPRSIRKRVMEINGKLVLAIDDADLYGSNEMVRLLRDLVPARSDFLFVFAVRSSKLENMSQALQRAPDVTLKEFTVPTLSNQDIRGLLDTLERHHRLGQLTGFPREKQEKEFRNKCGRQLLVAMIEATSGERFEEKAARELDELQDIQKLVYALLCVASRERHFLTRDEIALAAREVPGNGVGALRTLLSRGIVVAPPPAERNRARHRVVADLVFQHLVDQRQLKNVLIPLADALATKVRLPGDRRDRVWKLLVRLLNHDYLNRNIGLQAGRELYNKLEEHLNSDYHYWLQRGALEVESGNLRMAEFYLRTCRSMVEGDYLVDTEYAYMLLRKAVNDYQNPSAPAWFSEGAKLLEGVISTRGENDPYPFHVIGSQGLAWVHRTCTTRHETRNALLYYKNIVSQGCKKHPLDRDLQGLLQDIARESLSTVLP